MVGLLRAGDGVRVSLVPSRRGGLEVRPAPAFCAVPPSVKGEKATAAAAAAVPSTTSAATTAAATATAAMTAAGGAPTKPLVVLDLNGVLVERTKYQDRGKHRSGRSHGVQPYLRRPWCDWLVDFCFRHYEVAVWSCGKLENMEIDLFDGRELRLVLHQVKGAVNVHVGSQPTGKYRFPRLNVLLQSTSKKRLRSSSVRLLHRILI